MAHIHEKIDWTVGAFIVHKNKVLIRFHEKYHFWLAVGGHVELDEDASQAVIREAKEEVGLDITLIPPPHVEPEDMALRGDGYKELVPPFYMNIHQINDVHQHLDLIYVATSDTDEVVPESPTDKWVWLTEEEVRNHPDLFPDIRREALMALRVVGKLS
jgi:8-oxo-dGTP pyrophosphatase MutT (NUDIX family)